MTKKYCILILISRKRMVESLLAHQQTAGVVRLILSSLLTMMPAFSKGCIISFATSGLPKMMEPNKTGISLDIHQISWISKIDYYDIVLKGMYQFPDSLSCGTGVIALLMSKFLNEKIGRKKSLIAATLPQVVSIGCVYFCSSFYSLSIMIGLVNFFSSMMTVPGTLKLVSNRETFLIAGYSLLSEICLIRYRTPLATLNTSSTNMGWLLGLCIGLVTPLHLHYPTLGLSSVLFLLLCWLLPESPVWLMRRGREREAKQTLSWLRGNKYDIGPEMEDLQKIAELEDQSYGLSISDVFLDKRFLKPLGLCCILFTVQAMSGTVLISFYSAVIFKDIGISIQYVPMIYLVSMYGKQTESR